MRNTLIDSGKRRSTYRMPSHFKLSRSIDQCNKTAEETELDDVTQQVPYIDDGLDINGWFSKPLILPIESEKDNYIWTFLKLILYTWNGIYNKYTIFIKFILFIVYFIIGTVFYSQAEGWTVLNTVYYIVTSITTIGLGDFHPTTIMTQLFTMPYMVIGCTVMFNFFITFTKTYVKDCQDEIIFQIYRCQGLKEESIRPVAMSFYRVVISIVFVCITLLVGALFYSSNEGWPFLYSLYYSNVLIMLAIGYGTFYICLLVL